MTVLKMERSDSSQSLLVSDEVYGGTIFWAHSSDTDEDLVKDFLTADLDQCLHMRSYDEYKAEATDWRTIYEASV